MECFIDDREKDRIQPAKDYFINTAGFNTNVKELKFGDYVFKNNDLSVAFEYKTLPDYISSLNDYRVFNQAINQSNNFDYHFVIIEGTEDERKELFKDNQYYTNKYMTLNQYYGSIASIVNFSSILQVPNKKHGFILMHKVAEHCTNNKPVIKRFPKNNGSPAFRLLANIVGGIGERTAELICDELNLYCVEDVFNLKVDDLVKVKGVGNKTAMNILKDLKNEY